MKRNKVLKISIFLIIGLIIYYIAWRFLCIKCINLSFLKPENIKDYILGFGPLAIVIYVLLYTINTISLIPPIGIMSLSAGAILGPLWGTVGIMMGSFIGTTSTFFISRKIGGPFVQRIVKGKAKEFQDKLDKNGFMAILLVRLIPVLPWEVVNYASGLSKIKYGDYISATLLGIFPSVLIQVYFSHSAVNFNIKDPKVWAAIFAFFLLGAVPAIYIKLKKGKKNG